MYRFLCTTSRNITITSKKISTKPLTNNLRFNTTLAETLKAQKRTKKESGEFLKWILLMLPVGSFGLGSWQIYRLQWKLELMDRMHAKTNADPIEIPDDIKTLEQLEYMPVKVRGKFLHDKEFLIGPRALIDDSISTRFGSLVSDPKKNQGFLVVTPFMLAGSGEVILINRGWIPQSLRPKEKRQASFIKEEVELVGIVRLTEKRPPFMAKNNPEKGSWFYRDLEQMCAHTGASPVWLDARGIADPPEGWPLPNQTRITLRNEHMSYIVTWFSLAAFTGIMWQRHFIKKLPLL